jgi:hypothetical protein
MEQPVIIIPLSYDAKAVMGGKHVENLPSYSGSNLQLSFTPDERVRRAPGYEYWDQTDLTCLNASATAYVSNSAAAQAYTLEVLYVMSAVLEASNSTVDLQL